MTRPGVEVAMSAAPPSRGIQTRTGTTFFAGTTQRGRTDVAVLIHNMDGFRRYFGDRIPASALLYDSCDAAFQTGVADLYVGRVVGPAAAVDTITFNDSAAAPSISVHTLGGFVSGWKAAVVAGSTSGTVKVVVTDAANNVITRSPEYSTVADIVNWSQGDDFVRVSALGANLPDVAAATALAGGADDLTHVTDVVRTAALTGLFPKIFGPGQVAYPGATTTAVHVALCNFAQLTNRVALLDLADNADDAVASAEADAIRGSVDLDALSETFCLAVAPWHVISGIVTGTTRTIPPCAITAGLVAASDGLTGNPNVPAAGANGQPGILLRTSQPEWDDDTRQALNDKGVSVYRNVFGNWRLYGYRTLADQNVPDSAAWLSFAAARLRMAVTLDLDLMGEGFVFDQIDGQKQKINEYGGAIAGVLQTWWARGALFGASTDEAFSVDVGPTVNTDATLADQQLRSKIGLKTSPFAEKVYMEVTKRAIPESL